MALELQVLDSSSQALVHKALLTKAVFRIADDKDADLWLPGLPTLDVLYERGGQVILVSGKEQKTLKIGSGVKLPGAWRLSLQQKTGTDSGLLLLFEGPIEQKEPETPDNTKLWRGIGILLMLVVLSLPFWVPQLTPLTPELDPEAQPEDSAVSNTGGAPANSLSSLLEPMMSPGPLHPAHANVTQACSDCHQEGFSSIQIEPCLSCHTMKRHLTQAQTGVHPLCVTCHKEHEGEDRLVIRDQRLCTQCHQTHETLDAVLAEGVTVNLDVIAGFPESHPAFRPNDPYQNLRPGLIFSHAEHLEPLAREGETFDALDCASCHLPDERGQGFLAPTMEESCGGACHLLERQRGGSTERLGHGNLLTLFESVSPQQRFAEVEQHCGTCHLLPEKEPGDLAEWSLWAESLKIPEAGFKDLRFSHKRHEGRLACVDCHSGVEQSERVSDLLLPKLEACSSCHQSEAHSNEVIETTCASCHYFHTVDWD